MLDQMASRFHPRQARARSLRTARIVPCRRAQVSSFRPLRLHRGGLRHASSVNSCLIGQPLANDAIQQLVCASLANAMAHKPRGLESHAEGAVKLVRTDALLAGRDQENRLQPEAQRDVAGLENGADLNGERLAALVALVSADPGALTFHLADANAAGAVRADRAGRPDARFNEGISGFFVMELRGGKDRGSHDVFSVSAPSVRLRSGYVKYNIALFCRGSLA